MTLLQLVSRTTQTTSAVSSGVDISGITGDWTIKLQVESLVDSVAATTPQVRFAFEDTVTDYTASLAGPTMSFKGSLSNNADKVKSWKKQDFPDLRAGVALAQLRLRLSNIETGGTVIYHAWMEY